MADVLAHAKGISATEEDASAVGTSVSKFVAQGKAKGLQQYGIIGSGTRRRWRVLPKLSWQKRMVYQSIRQQVERRNTRFEKRTERSRQVAPTMR